MFYNLVLLIDIEFGDLFGADFYNWNRVKLRYCDGASFAGDALFDNGVIFSPLISHIILKLSFEIFFFPIKPHLISCFQQMQTSLLYFKGQKIWESIILDLLPKGLATAQKV